MEKGDWEKPRATGTKYTAKKWGDQKGRPTTGWGGGGGGGGVEKGRREEVERKSKGKWEMRRKGEGSRGKGDEIEGRLSLAFMYLILNTMLLIWYLNMLTIKLVKMHKFLQSLDLISAKEAPPPPPPPPPPPITT